MVSVSLNLLSEELNDMNEKPPSTATAFFRQKFEQFKQLSAQGGEEFAWETMLEGYTERQRRQMGHYIDNASLADGFRKAIPAFRQIGMEMDVVDISTSTIDGALEIQRTCPALKLYQEYGFAKPCHVICEMDVEATRRAFPGMRGEILCAQADGACVCTFKYERNSSADREQIPPQELAKAPSTHT
jgi:predicted ArsR family transcriptional regulator